MTNISAIETPVEPISRLLAVIGQPVRIQILWILGAREACVCHLEAVLGVRQASISQHLMALRKAGLVTSAREGRNIYYRLTSPAALTIIEQAAALLGSDPGALRGLTAQPVPGCPCPLCNPNACPDLSCDPPASRQTRRLPISTSCTEETNHE